MVFDDYERELQRIEERFQRKTKHHVQALVVAISIIMISTILCSLGYLTFGEHILFLIAAILNQMNSGRIVRNN